MEKIIQPLENAFAVSPELAFITNSLIHLTALKQNKKFDTNIVLDSIIFANQTTIFCLAWGVHDSIKLFSISEFKTMISSVFAQDISPEEQPFDQILAVQDGQLEFISIHSENIYMARNTSKLHHVHKMVQKIIFKEKKLINNLDSFLKMLQQSNILEPPKSKKKRSFFDLFSPFSLQSVALNANKNYEAMNSNFQHIQEASRIMKNNQKIAISQMNNISKQEKQVYRKSLFLEFNSLTQNVFDNYIISLQTILENIKLSPVFDIAFHLLTFSQKCSGIFCFTNPYFRKLNETSLSVTFERSHQSLAKSVFITCTINAQKTTSVYSNKFALLDKNDMLLFQDKSLRSIRLDELLHPTINEMRKPIDTNNCLLEILCPIFSDKLVSFQCINVTQIIIDDRKFTCSPHILNFLPFPQKIEINGKTIKFQASSHFSQKISKYANNYGQITLFQNRENNHTIFKKFQNFIIYATPNTKFAFFSGLLLVFFLFLSSCLVLACCKPGCLDALFFCCSKSCIIRRALQRQIRVNNPVHQPAQELQPMNPRPANELCAQNLPGCQCLRPNYNLICRGRMRIQ